MRRALALLVVLAGCPRLPPVSGCTPGAQSCIADAPHVCSTSQRWQRAGDLACSAVGGMCVVLEGGRTVRPLTTEQARAFADHLASLHRATIVAPSDPAAVGARAIIAALAHLSPALDEIAAGLETHLERVSICVPTPAGSLILLSPSAVADPTRYAMTAAHECQHAAQRESLGFGQVIIDYVASPELRARAEADAYSVGLYVGYLLTGILPLASEAMDSLASATYHLAPDDIELARGIVESHLESMSSGLPPPIAVAVEAHAWLSRL